MIWFDLIVDNSISRTLQIYKGGSGPVPMRPPIAPVSLEG
jgi:hypothetical protein